MREKRYVCLMRLCVLRYYVDVFVLIEYGIYQSVLRVVIKTARFHYDQIRRKEIRVVPIRSFLYSFKYASLN